MRIRKNLFLIVKKIVFWKNLLSYVLLGRKPWKRGYFEYKWRYITKILRDQKTITDFQDENSLPEHFGQGIDERVVEYPWLIANTPNGTARLLDAGSALNFEMILSNPKLTDKKITIINLNPESNCFWNLGVSYLFEDLRNLPFKSDSFDVISCISTLEHIGMNNTKIYTSDTGYKESNIEDYLVAITEMKRVLKIGGVLLLTVPFGRYANFGWFQQFNKEMIDKLIALFGDDKCNSTFYRYAENGWQVSNVEECASAEYIIADRSKLNSSLPAAASAIACLKLVK